MRITILGPGAIGCLLAGLLARAGEKVTLLDYRPERAAEISQRGVSIKSADNEFAVPVRATADPAEIIPPELLLVCVKAFRTEAAAKPLASCVGDETAVLTLQNGLGNVEQLSAVFGKARVLGGVTGHGAILQGAGQVLHTGVGETVIGEQSGQVTARLEQIKSSFDRANISTTVTADLAGAVWGKVVVNCAINPLAALTRLRNGDLLGEPSLADLLEKVAAEAAQIATANGVQLPYPDPGERMRQVCRQTAGNINSMLADVLSRRPTEINQINGAVARAAAAAGVPAPLNQALTALVSAVEKNYTIRVETEK